MNIPDLSTYFLFAAVACVGIPAILAGLRRLVGMGDTEITYALRTERLMRRFILHPTQRNYSAVWEFVREHDVRLGSIDWNTVRRFTLASLQTNFTCDA